MQTITSRENPLVKDLVSLMGNRRERHARGLFVTESYKTALEASNADFKPCSVLVTQQALERHDTFIEALAQKGAKEYLIAPGVAQKISDAASAQGFFCVWELKKKSDGDYFPLDNARIMVLSSLQDPGNVGAIIRSCEAFGLDALILSADCPDIYSPKLLRAAAGGIFRLPIYISDDIAQTVVRLRDQNVMVYAAALSEQGRSPRDIRGRGAVCVLIGNEGNGLDAEIVRLAHECVTIPMAGGAESLNAACAAAILAWELSLSRDDVNPTTF